MMCIKIQWSLSINNIGNAELQFELAWLLVGKSDALSWTVQCKISVHLWHISGTLCYTLTNISRAAVGSVLEAGGCRPTLCRRPSTSGSLSTSRVSSNSCSSTARPEDKQVHTGYFNNDASFISNTKQAGIKTSHHFLLKDVQFFSSRVELRSWKLRLAFE